MHSSPRAKDLAEKGFSFVERELLFTVEHPDLKNLTQYLRGTYRMCKAKELGSAPVELDEAYEHIFGAPGQPACSWCQREFALATRDIRNAEDPD